MNDQHQREIYEQKFETVSLDKASELLSKLRLSDPIWTTNPQGDNEWSRSWYFRGQGDASWQLIPSAWRQSKDSPILQGRNDPMVTGWIKAVVDQMQRENVSLDVKWHHIQYASEQIITELRLVREFLTFADSVGHRVPDSKIPSLAQKDWVRRITIDLAPTNITAPTDTPRANLHRKIWLDPGIVLAQHHGIPTRLLDWTRNPLAAAYFAASDAINNSPASGLFAIYAMHTLHLNPQKVIDVLGKQSDNEFLRAQEGVCLVDIDADTYYVEHGCYPDIMSSLFEIGDMPTNQYRPKKITLPIGEAYELIRLLFLERVTKAHLMPTLDSVAQTIKDKWRFVLAPGVSDDDV